MQIRKILRVVGLDPSMRSFGMARGLLHMEQGFFAPTDIELIETTISKLKRVRKNSDDLDRAKSLYIHMTAFIQDADLIFVEIPVGSQSARSMASYGMCIGVLASITTNIIQVTAAEVKLAVCGIKKATKASMIQWAATTYPKLDYFTINRKGENILTKKNEHIADALATVHAGVKTEQFKQLLTMSGYKLEK